MMKERGAERESSLGSLVVWQIKVDDGTYVFSHTSVHLFQSSYSYLLPH
jgi:hypothetical protein